jgi:hypothetical protein
VRPALTGHGLQLLFHPLVVVAQQLSPTLADLPYAALNTKPVRIPHVFVALLIEQRHQLMPHLPLQ